MKGAVFVSDERMEYAARVLQEKGIDLDIAFDSQQGERIVSGDPSVYDFILAPIRGAIDGNMTLQGESFSVDSFLNGLRPGIPVITGFKSEYMMKLGINLVSFQDDDAFCRQNGKLTAEGVLKMIIENTKESIYSYRYDIVGTGRSGCCIKELLEKLGLPVRMISHSRKEDSLSMDEWRRSEPSSIVINATPKSICDLADLKQWKKEITIIDISSMRMNKEKVEQTYPNVHYFPAPPLPGTVAPKTAGILLGNFVWEVIGCH